MRVGLFSLATSDWRGYSLKTAPGGVQVGHQKELPNRHWNGQQREGVDWLSLEVFKTGQGT